jgi:hypothetical protein
MKLQLIYWLSILQFTSTCAIAGESPAPARDGSHVGEFNGNRGEFYDQEQYKGCAILVRYVWSNVSPKSARMEQSFSADGGKTWETNWICELSR